MNSYSCKKNKKNFYVTTPIYYVNAKPHLGTLYSTLLADAVARYNKLWGKEVFFLTGTDEHGGKVAEAAQKVGKSPKDFVDNLVGSFTSLWEKYGIEYDHFIRTTDDYHIKAVGDWIKRLMEQGDIYKSTYEGWYCTSQEAFLTDKDLEYKEKGEPPNSIFSGKPAKWISEECYFFKLSVYQEKLLEFYKNNPDFVTPAERLNEVISFVESGLKDLSVSRKTLKWGIPFPGDPEHVTYVWADALNNYITAIGYGQEGKQEQFKKFWPADLHILGKDIVRFHAVYWPAFLMATGLEIPCKMLVHGWIKIDGAKMSKSLGNIVDPVELAKAYGVEPVRYYLMRYMAVTQDSSFGTGDLEEKLNSDLANDLGNLLNRLLLLSLKNNLVKVDPPRSWEQEEQDLQKLFGEMFSKFKRELDKYFFHNAYSYLNKYVADVNRYFHKMEPWKLSNPNSERFNAVVSATCHSLRAIAILLWPLMPKKMEKLLSAIGQELRIGYDYISELESCTWHHSFELKKIELLFQKYESKSLVPAEEKKEEKSSITIDDLIKIELRVGEIKKVEDIPKSKKIYVMTVDFGEYGTRTICAGVKEHYKPEELLDKKSVFVFNLVPRKILGIESQGMMMMAKSKDGIPTIIEVEKNVPNGRQLS